MFLYPQQTDIISLRGQFFSLTEICIRIYMRTDVFKVRPQGNEVYVIRDFILSKENYELC